MQSNLLLLLLVLQETIETMPFKEGKSGNPYGRPRNSINRLGLDMREDLTKFLKRELPNIKKEFASIKNPYQKVKLFVDLISFAIPRLKSTDEPILANLTDADLDRIIERLKTEHDAETKITQN